MTDTYTEEELNQLPQTQAVFNQPKLEFDNHTWIQQGYQAFDQCCGHPPVTLPSGKTLIRKDGHYDLVDELRT